MNLLPFTVITPTKKITINVFPMRKITGQGSPLAPGFNYVKNGVDHLTNIDRTREDAPFFPGLQNL